jgi:heme-degrading monooxygenase HmoA
MAHSRPPIIDLRAGPTRASRHRLRHPPTGADLVILEIADIRIAPGQQAAFDEAIQRGVSTVISQARGMKGWKVNHSIESPERYILQIFWETLEDHTVHFRGGPLFPQWRAIVGPFFASPPVVEHFTLVGMSS